MIDKIKEIVARELMVDEADITLETDILKNTLACIKVHEMGVRHINCTVRSNTLKRCSQKQAGMHLRLVFLKTEA